MLSTSLFHTMDKTILYKSSSCAFMQLKRMEGALWTAAHVLAVKLCVIRKSIWRTPSCLTLLYKQTLHLEQCCTLPWRQALNNHSRFGGGRSLLLGRGARTNRG